MEKRSCQGRQLWWCDLALVLEQSLTVRAEGLRWSQSSPSQLFPGRLLARRHPGDPECEHWEPGGGWRFPQGLQRHLWEGWEKGVSLSGTELLLTGERKGFLKNSTAQDIPKGAKYYPLPTLMWCGSLTMLNHVCTAQKPQDILYTKLSSTVGVFTCIN